MPRGSERQSAEEPRCLRLLRRVRQMLDGIEFLQAIMELHPLPLLIASSRTEAGAMGLARPA